MNIFMLIRDIHFLLYDSCILKDILIKYYGIGFAILIHLMTHYIRYEIAVNAFQKYIESFANKTI